MTLVGAPQGTPIPQGDAHLRYVLRHADDNLVVAQRLGEWISRGPELEDDIALANIALDHLGVARALLTMPECSRAGLAARTTSPWAAPSASSPTSSSSSNPTATSPTP